jgi:spermidine synthase
MIGLASGSWAQVIANDSEVESLTIVEINPGYLPLIAQRPAVRKLLQNPKVAMVIDDGRRWLLHHPERKFDLVVSNTTWNWRANASNLLSIEFLELVRAHLNPGAIFYYNTTWSPEAMITGARVFPYALRISNFLAVSDSPIRLEQERTGRCWNGTWSKASRCLISLKHSTARAWKRCLTSARDSATTGAVPMATRSRPETPSSGGSSTPARSRMTTWGRSGNNVFTHPNYLVTTAAALHRIRFM